MKNNFSRRSKLLFLVVVWLLPLGCKVDPDRLIGRDEVLLVTVTKSGRRVGEAEIHQGSKEYEQFIAWFRRNANGWSPAFVTYAPGVLVTGASFSMNFISESAVLNDFKAQRQYAKTVSPSDYAYLEQVTAQNTRLQSDGLQASPSGHR